MTDTNEDTANKQGHEDAQQRPKPEPIPKEGFEGDDMNIKQRDPKPEPKEREEE